MTKSSVLYFLGLFLAQLIQAEEEIAHCHKANQQNEDPLEHAAHALGLQIHEEIGVDQRRGGGGNQNGGIKLQNRGLNEDESHIATSGWFEVNIHTGEIKDIMNQ